MASLACGSDRAKQTKRSRAWEKSVAVLWQDENRRRFHPVVSCALPHTEPCCPIKLPLKLGKKCPALGGHLTLRHKWAERGQARPTATRPKADSSIQHRHIARPGIKTPFASRFLNTLESTWWWQRASGDNAALAISLLHFRWASCHRAQISRPCSTDPTWKYNTRPDSFLKRGTKYSAQSRNEPYFRQT